MPRLRTWRSQGSHSSETWTQYVVQPTQCINQLSSWYGTTFRKKSRKLFRGRDLILMKLKPHVSLAGSSTNSPFRVFLSTRGPKIAQAWQKSIGVKTLTIWVCVYQIWGLYITFKAMNADKWLWPIFGCKVSQKCPDWNETRTWHVTPPARCICQVSNWYLTTCTKKVRKTFHWLGVLVTPPFKCFCPPEGQKLPNHDENQ